MAELKKTINERGGEDGEMEALKERERAVGGWGRGIQHGFS